MTGQQIVFLPVFSEVFAAVSRAVSYPLVIIIIRESEPEADSVPAPENLNNRNYTETFPAESGYRKIL